MYLQCGLMLRNPCTKRCSLDIVSSSSGTRQGVHFGDRHMCSMSVHVTCFERSLLLLVDVIDENQEHCWSG